MLTRPALSRRSRCPGRSDRPDLVESARCRHDYRLGAQDRQAVRRRQWLAYVRSRRRNHRCRERTTPGRNRYSNCTYRIRADDVPDDTQPRAAFLSERSRYCGARARSRQRRTARMASGGAQRAPVDRVQRAVLTAMVTKLDWPLMSNNITRADLDALIRFLREDHVLTQSH